jgi:hypothetical protein
LLLFDPIFLAPMRSTVAVGAIISAAVDYLLSGQLSKEIDGWR